MPETADADAEAFGTDSIVDYFREITEYSASKGMKNSVCVMLGTYGMSLDVVDRICSLPHMDNIGSDPYWLGVKEKNPDLVLREFNTADCSTQSQAAVRTVKQIQTVFTMLKQDRAAAKIRCAILFTIHWRSTDNVDCRARLRVV